MSDGAFDITFASVGHLYDYRQGVAPDAAALERARQAVGWRHLQLDAGQRTIRFGRDGMRIDLGGFAKGHVVDTSIAILKRLGIQHAMVAAGGDSHVMGDRRGRPWSIAIRDPRDDKRVVAVLPLQDTSISTSGDYERYFERDGVRHHHLIDPKTGTSPRSVRSVTILANDGLTSEGLSKCLFVMGLERGMRLVESVPGVDAVVVDAAGSLAFLFRFGGCRPRRRRRNPAVSFVRPSQTNFKEAVMTSQIKKTVQPALCTLAAMLLLAGCSGSGDSEDTVAVNGDVAIAYAKRVNSLSMNPTDGAPFAAGGDLIIREKSSPSAPEHNVTANYTRGNGDVSDPEVSYDGKKVVFAMNCPTSNNAAIGSAVCTGRWNIWEYTLPSGGYANGTMRRITSSTTDDDVDPYYLPERRLRVRIEPPDQDAQHAGRGCAAVLRARRIRARACAEPAHDGQRRRRTSRRSRATRATTATRWCATTATSCSRAGSTWARATALRCSRSSPMAPTCSCSTVRKAAATASCTRARWTRTARTAASSRRR